VITASTDKKQLKTTAEHKTTTRLNSTQLNSKHLGGPKKNQQLLTRRTNKKSPDRNKKEDNGTGRAATKRIRGEPAFEGRRRHLVPHLAIHRLDHHAR